jgi:hypothetical protein
MGIGAAQIEFMNEFAGAAVVIFVKDDAEPILGVSALESVGIEVGLKNQPLRTSSCRSAKDAKDSEKAVNR